MTKRHKLHSSRLSALLALLLTVPAHAHASFLHGDTLDAVADGIAWFALILVPIVGIVVFLAIHILPEKIAHKKNHPQTPAIQCLCLLSLVFGGMLWPFAWLWAYSKPVVHKMAYGTDTSDSHGSAEAPAPLAPSVAEELAQLRATVAELKAQIKGGQS